MRLLRLATALLLTAVSLTACSTHSDRMAGFRDAWHAGEFLRADAELNQHLRRESGSDFDPIFTTAGHLPPGLNVQKGDTPLLLLEKGMTLLAQGNLRGATACFRAARDALDAAESSDAGDFIRAALSDDTAYDYAGGDYERIMVRLMLALTDLISATGDAKAFALQVGEKQEQILGSPLGENVGYQPRQSYRRVGAGAYLEGMMLEAQSAYSEAAMVYRRMLSWEPDSQLARSSLSRVTDGTPVKPGHGVLHVFWLAGRGPHLTQRDYEPTSSAIQIAGLYMGLAHNRWSVLAQTKIQVPALVVNQPSVPAFSLTSEAAAASTQPLLDVNRVAREQLEAWMPMIGARALVRRATKTGIAATIEEVGARSRDRGTGTALRAAAIIGNLIWTATETADTRSWSTLPAQVQAARIELPEGLNMVSLGNTTAFIGGAGQGEPQRQVGVRITAGRDHYLLLIQPDLSRPGVALLDPFTSQR